MSSNWFLRIGVIVVVAAGSYLIFHYSSRQRHLPVAGPHEPVNPPPPAFSQTSQTQPKKQKPFYTFRFIGNVEGISTERARALAEIARNAVEKHKLNIPPESVPAIKWRDGKIWVAFPPVNLPPTMRAGDLATVVIDNETNQPIMVMGQGD